METVLRGQSTLNGHTTIPSEWPLNTGSAVSSNKIRIRTGRWNCSWFKFNRYLSEEFRSLFTTFRVLSANGHTTEFSFCNELCIGLSCSYIPGVSDSRRGWLFKTPYSWMKHLRHSSSHYQELDLWIMQFKSFHDLAIIGYGSLYCVRARRRATPEAFLYIVTIRCSYKIKLARLMYICPRAFLIQQLFHYHRISNKLGWTNCLLRVL